MKPIVKILPVFISRNNIVLLQGLSNTQHSGVHLGDELLRTTTCFSHLAVARNKGERITAQGRRETERVWAIVYPILRAVAMCLHQPFFCCLFCIICIFKGALI